MCAKVLISSDIKKKALDFLVFLIQKERLPLFWSSNLESLSDILLCKQIDCHSCVFG